MFFSTSQLYLLITALLPFLPIFSASWSFSSSFQDLAFSSLYGEILDYSIVGDYKEDLSMLYFAWTSRTTDKSYINSAFAYNTGVEMPSDKVDEIVESYDILVNAPSDYIVNGYKKIDICLNELSCPVIIAIGTSSRIFELEESGFIGIWNNEFIDIDAIGNGIVVNTHSSGGVPRREAVGYRVNIIRATQGKCVVVNLAEGILTFFYIDSGKYAIDTSAGNDVVGNDKFILVNRQDY